MGSDQSCRIISSLARLGVSGRRRVFVHLCVGPLARLTAHDTAVLKLPEDSRSRYHLFVLFNQGIKSFWGGNYSDCLSAGSEA